MNDLFDLVSLLVGRDEADHTFGFGVIEAGLGLLFQLPSKPGLQTGGSNKSDRIFEKAVVTDQTKNPRLEVGDPVERIHKQTVGAFIERKRHGVRGKVAAAKVLKNAPGVVDRLARLGELFAAGAADLNPHTAGKAGEKSMRGSMLAPDYCASLLESGLQLGDFSLHGDIEVSDRRAAG